MRNFGYWFLVFSILAIVGIWLLLKPVTVENSHSESVSSSEFVAAFDDKHAGHKKIINSGLGSPDEGRVKNVLASQKWSLEYLRDELKDEDAEILFRILNSRNSFENASKVLYILGFRYPSSDTFHALKAFIERGAPPSKFTARERGEAYSMKVRAVTMLGLTQQPEASTLLTEILQSNEPSGVLEFISGDPIPEPWYSDDPGSYFIDIRGAAASGLVLSGDPDNIKKVRDLDEEILGEVRTGKFRPTDTSGSPEDVYRRRIDTLWSLCIDALVLNDYRKNVPEAAFFNMYVCMDFEERYEQLKPYIYGYIERNERANPL